MLAQRIQTHVDDAIKRLLSQYADSPRMVGLLTALVKEVQALEDAIFELDAARALTGHPVGVQLDKLGELIGFERNGLSDDAYRAVLRGVVASNYSDGSSDTLVRAAAALFQALAIFRKDPNSTPQWPGLHTTGGTPEIPWVMPGDAIYSHTTSPITQNTSGGVFITPGTGGAFGYNGRYIFDPGLPTQEVFAYIGTPPVADEIYIYQTFQYDHPVGTVVMFSPFGDPLPAPTPGTPPDLVVTGAAGEPIGAIALGIGSPQLDPADFPVVQKILLSSAPAGVGVFYLSIFKAEGAFACAGPQAWVRGWGDLNDPSTGGPMADLLYNNPAM